MKKQSRQEKIEDLRKQQERRDFLSDFLISLSAIAGRHIIDKEVLTFEVTKAVIQKIYYKESQIPTYIIRFPFSQAEKLRELLTSLKEELKESEAYLATYKFYRSFFLQLNCAFIIQSFEKIIELDSNTFYIYHKHLNDGLSIDCNEENWTENGETKYIWTYELKVWGNQWVNKIHQAYNNLINE